ncbi:hypothetical protein [Paenibacillus eucommiae]|uniref:DUF1294 domain-containing protein n=1 Tax=Paenibacillus eucommiae TaxID=1355755 RepID=A0ABS4JAG9_9BACL|nr:hypothetical protein [Paenibacillus eucommiae]MBP1996795.1 hypothetical protein [Paenibacillus eucommiae]
MELGLGLFVIVVLGTWLLMLIAFALSFVKQKHVSTISYMFFVIASALGAYATADETSFSKPLHMASTQEIIFAYVPLLCCVGSIASGVLWFYSKKRIARWLGLISLLLAIYIYMKI